MQHPAQYAVHLLSRFKQAAKARGIPHVPIQLQHGDFLKSLEVRSTLATAGVVYMNNPKFGPELDSKVLEQLCPVLEKGCKLVCFESLIGTRGYWNFCMRYVTSFDCAKGSVSWHGKGVTLHVLEKI